MHPETPNDPGEQDRLRAIYGRYSADERRARAWSAENAGNRQIRAELVAAALEWVGTPQTTGELVDIGCGSGWWVESLALRGAKPHQLYGLELLPHRAEAARRRIPGAHIVEGDAGRLPWESDRFRAATLFTVLSSMGSAEKQTQALKEAVRVLRPGGHLLIWEPRVLNPRNPDTRLVRLAALRDALGSDLEVRAITVLPALARRLGRLSGAYPVLARIPLLRTHRLIHHRKL